jgi:hypothetical protein
LILLFFALKQYLFLCALQTAAPDVSSVVSFISASHGHVVSAVQVHAYRKPYVIDRTFRFYQPEGDILKRAIQLLPGSYYSTYT